MTYQNALVSIIIVCHNRKKDVLECIQSVRNSDYKNIETLVVDNGSTDGTVETLKQTKGIRLIEAGHDLGPAAAFNLGIKKAKGQYFLLLNDDVILARDAITELVRLIESDNRIGVAGSLIHYYDDPEKIWMYPNQFREEKNPYLDVVTIIGCSIMLSRAAIEKTGMLETDYFLYHEEVDFSLRARNQGFRVVCALKSTVYHKIPVKSFGEAAKKHALINAYYTNRNNFLFAKKNYKTTNEQLINLLKSFLFYPRFTTGTPQLRNYPWVPFVQALVTLDLSYIRAYVKGINAGLKWFRQPEQV